MDLLLFVQLIQRSQVTGTCKRLQLQFVHHQLSMYMTLTTRALHVRYLKTQGQCAIKAVRIYIYTYLINQMIIEKNRVVREVRLM